MMVDILNNVLYMVVKTLAFIGSEIWNHYNILNNGMVEYVLHFKIIILVVKLD
jgi:hypothetical protein